MLVELPDIPVEPADPLVLEPELLAMPLVLPEPVVAEPVPLPVELLAVPLGLLLIDPALPEVPELPVEPVPELGVPGLVVPDSAADLRTG